MFVDPSRRKKLEKTCPGAVPHGQMGPVTSNGEDCMQDAMKRVQREATYAAAEERDRWDRAAKARKKRAELRSDRNVTGAFENVTQEADAVMSGQEGLVVAIKYSVAPASKAAAGAMPADVRSMPVTGDVVSQRSTRDEDALQ